MKRPVPCMLRPVDFWLCRHRLARPSCVCSRETSIIDAMWSKSCLFLLALCVWSSHCQPPGCVDPPGIVVTPSTNQTVAVNSDTTKNYRCNVYGAGRAARWNIAGTQFSFGSPESDSLATEGIVITNGSNDSEVFLSINRTGREFVKTQGLDLTVACLFTMGGFVGATTGCDYYVRTFDSPSIPPNLDFNPFPSNLSRLVLTWDQPDNTLMDTGDPVVTTYTVTVSGPTFNFTNTTTDTRYEIVDSLDEDCASHTFTVFASNDAGDGPSDVINETIPISPDIRNLSAQLTVSDVILATPIRVEATFLRAIACSSNFPLTSYLINIMGVASTSFSTSDSRVAGKEMITLGVDHGLQPNQAYSLSVSACISVTCRESSTVTFMTTDVQSARLTFFENNIYLSCSFASSSPAQGCVFIFTASSNITERFNVSQSESRTCAQLQNMENVYTSIVALDWESDGSYGSRPISINVNETASAEEFMQVTSCSLPTVPVEIVTETVTEIVPMELSGGAIAGIVIAVIFVAVVVGVVVVVIVVKARKQVEKEGQKLLAEKKAGVRVSCIPKEERMGVEEIDGVQGGPPPLHVNQEDEAKFQLQLNRGRKDGEIVINRNMLDNLVKMMGGNSEVKYRILVPESDQN